MLLRPRLDAPVQCLAQQFVVPIVVIGRRPLALMTGEHQPSGVMQGSR